MRIGSYFQIRRCIKKNESSVTFGFGSVVEQLSARAAASRSGWGSRPVRLRAPTPRSARSHRVPARRRQGGPPRRRPSVAVAVGAQSQSSPPREQAGNDAPPRLIRLRVMSVVNYSYAAAGPAIPVAPAPAYGPSAMPYPAAGYLPLPATPAPPSYPQASPSRDPYRGYRNRNPGADYNQQAPRSGGPARSPHYTRINTNSASSRGKTTLHAVVDYDDDLADEYYDDGVDDDVVRKNVRGPIHAKNGSVPVVPLFSYPVLSNGSVVQIPVS